MTNGMLTDEQQNQVQDIVRLIPAEEWAAFLDMLAHELRGRELNGGDPRGGCRDDGFRGIKPTGPTGNA